jgi:hypothetical protein
VILGKTYGWHKRQDKISVSQFEQETGIDRRHTVRTIKELESMNIITVQRDSTKTAIYSFQKNFDEWLLPNKATVKHKQLLPNEDKAIALPGNKTISLSGNHKSNKAIIKNNIVRKLSSNESLEVYLLTLPEYQNLSSQLKESVLTFINKVRLSNRTKKLAASRVNHVFKSFLQIRNQYGSDKLEAGIDAVFRKEQKEGFSYSSHDPAAYVRTVAKSLHIAGLQKANEAQVKKDKEALKVVQTGKLFNELQSLIKDQR